MKKKSKRYKEILKLANKSKKVDVKEVLELVKKNSTTKFDESIDVSLRINLKQTKGGDLKALGCKGTNNYNDYWNERNIYNKF